MNPIFKFAKQFIWHQFLKNGFQNLEFKKDDLIVDYWDNNKNGDIIFLLHGFGLQTEFQWYKQIKTLSKKNRVIIPNLLYFGKTTQHEKYQLQDQVNLVKIIAKSLNLQKFDLMGLSYGGLIAIEFCNQNIDIVKKLILVDSPIKYFNNKDLKKIYQIYRLENIEELFAARDFRGLKKQFKAAYHFKHLIPNFIYKIFYNNLCLPNIENWERLILELKLELDIYAKKEYSFEHPTLLIWGEHDDIVPSRIGSQLNNHLKNSRLEIIKRSKHLPNLEQSKKFNKLIIEFLQN